MEKRVCKTCKEEKNIDEFANAGIQNGKQFYRHVCKKCYYQNKLPRRNKIRVWFSEYKKTLACERCGNSDHRVLEFHHHRDKDFEISNAAGRGYGLETIKKEIEKCEVLCANCHKIEHYEDVV